MYGVGFTVFYYPILGMVNEYWIARRGMAYGLLCSASGFSGLFMPLTLEALLKKYGLATTLRAVAIGLAVCTGPLIPLLRTRTPQSDEITATSSSAGTNHTVPPTDWGFLRVPLFWIYTVSNLMQGLGYFFPALYLPSYATTMGMSATKGALLLAIMSVAQVLGQLSFGYLSDRRFSVNVLTLTSTSVSAVAVLALWGLAQRFPVLCVFTMIYGFFGAGYTAMWARMGTAVTSDGTAAFAAFGLFNFGKGLGNVLAGPISAGLLLNSVDTLKYGAGRYKAVILFAGSCMLASAVSATLCYFRPWKAPTARR
jgi:predicted MFS family arabinose efflux permease